MWATHWKNMLRSKDFFLAFAFCTAFMVIATVGELLQLYGDYSASLGPASYYFGYEETAYDSILKMALGPFIIFIFPFAGPVAYGWSYYAHRKSNLLPLLLARKSRSSYFCPARPRRFCGLSRDFYPAAHKRAARVPCGAARFPQDFAPMANP